MTFLPDTLLHQMTEQARAEADYEVCGLIGCHHHDHFQLYPVANVADHKGERFEMDPAQQIAAMRQMRERGEHLYAIYHSHPTTAAVPSATDRELASHPDALYLIISLRNPIPEIRGYRWTGNDFREVTLKG